MLRSEARFVAVAGSGQMLVTSLPPSALDTAALRIARTVGRNPVPTNRSRTRSALLVPVSRRHGSLPDLSTAGAVIEHLHDY
jgi:hypothetical protein